MPSKLLTTGIAITLLGVFYQTILRNILFFSLGIGRTVQNIGDFPYTCRRIYHPLLESCEDLVVDEEGRRVYATCSDRVTRMGWMPNNDNLNTTARLAKDHISILDIDTPGPNGFYNVRTLTIPTTYQSAAGNQEIDVHALTLHPISKTRFRLMINNHRPPTDVDVHVYGANSTIEVFEFEKGSESLEFVRTVSDEAVYTPNAVVDLGEEGLLVTNDHTGKVGKSRNLEMFWRGGSVAYCPPTPSTPCNIASTKYFNFPNGITYSPPSSTNSQGLVYVANSGTGLITVLTLNTTTKTLDKVAEIDIKMPIDNLKIDSKGDIYVPGFPDVVGLMASSHSLMPRDVGSTVFRVQKVEGLEWEVEKILEDGEGKTLPASTVVAHDPKTGNLWLASIASSFITVCEKI